MNWNKDKVDAGSIKHVFKTDKFERSGLDVIFESNIKYSFEENDLVSIDVVREETIMEMNQYRVNNKAFTLVLDKPAIVTKLVFNKGENLYKAIFEQIDNTNVRVVLLKTDSSPGGTFYDTTKREHMYHEVNGVYNIKITGKPVGENNGVYTVTTEKWKKLIMPAENIQDVTYSLKCSAVSVNGLIKIILPHNSEPAIPELVPEVDNELKMVDHIYLSPNVILLNIIRITNSDSGYKVNLGTENAQTVLTEKIDFTSFIPDFNLYFPGHTVTKNIVFEHEYAIKFGRLHVIKWEYAKTSSISNVFLDKVGVNDTHNIDGMSEFIIDDTILVRKQDENEENGIYIYNGEQFKSKYVFGQKFDDYYIVKNGSKKGLGVNVFGIFGYLTNFTFTSDKIETVKYSTVDPEIITSIVNANPNVPIVQIKDVKQMDLIIYVLIGSFILALMIKSLRRQS